MTRMFFLIFLLNVYATSIYSLSEQEVHYNTPDPDCSGPFGLCTQEDKDKLGYLAIKKLHEKMDDDHDGQIEIQETKEFLTEELEYKNDERHQKFHGNDLGISVEEMWKSWKYSDVYNWTTNDVVTWLNEQVKLPQYGEYFRRNRIDGQLLPRFALNENNYFTNVMHIKDLRHKQLIMIKAADLVLFGQSAKPHNLIKDVIMITALTLSIFVIIYLYTKHRKSLEQIKKMMDEFDQLTTSDEIASNSAIITHLKNNLNVKTEDDLRMALFSRLGRKSIGKSTSDPESLEIDNNQKENQSILQANLKLLEELTLAKQDAENLRKTLENTDGQNMQLKLTEELEKTKNALKQAETRMETLKYQPPSALISLLNRTHDNEKELLEYKFKLIDKEKESCMNALNQVSKKQSGILGALKIAHSTTLEELNHKLELLKREIQKCKSERNEWTKRWNKIDELCNRNEAALIANSSENISAAIDNTFLSLDNGLILPRKFWHNCPNVTSYSYALKHNNEINTNFKRVNTACATTMHQNGFDNELAYSKNSKSVLNSLVHVTMNSAVNQSKPLKFTLESLNSKTTTSNSNLLFDENNRKNSYNSHRGSIGGAHNLNINKTNMIENKNSLPDNANHTQKETHYQAISSELISANSIKIRDSNNNNQISLNLNKNGQSNEIQDINLSPPNYSPINYFSTNRHDSFKSIVNPVTPVVATSLTYQNSLESNNSLSVPNKFEGNTSLNNTSRIKRESLIHKNDVFQFDDVDSVHTSDIYFKTTPHSSFDSSSDETWKSKPSTTMSQRKRSNISDNKKTQKHSSKLSYFITPMFRSNSNSSNLILKNKSPRKNLEFNSEANVDGSKIKKSNTNSAISTNSELKKLKEMKKNGSNSASVTSLGTEPFKSHKSSFIRHFNSFRKRINNITNQKSTPNLAVPIELSIPETNDSTINNNNTSILTNVTSPKQLTILVNNNNTNYNDEKNESKLILNMQNNDRPLENLINNDISIPMISNSTSSFTIKNRLQNEDEVETTNHESYIKKGEVKKVKTLLKTKSNKNKN